MTKDPTYPGLLLEPGPVLRSNGGFCCLGNLERLVEKYSLKEVMEQQAFLLSHDDHVFCLNLRTSVLASLSFDGGGRKTSRSLLSSIVLHDSSLANFDIILSRKDDTSPAAIIRASEHILKFQTLSVPTPPVPYTKQEIEAYIMHRSSESTYFDQSAIDTILTLITELRATDSSHLHEQQQISRRSHRSTARCIISLIKVGEAISRMRGCSVIRHSDIMDSSALVL